MNLTVEKWYPATLALIAAALCWYFSFSIPSDEKEFLAAALSLGAVLTGFIATAQAILMALPSDSVMGRIRASGYLKELVDYLAAALHGGLFFCALCLAGFFLLHSAEDVKRVYAVAVGWAAVFSVMAFYRVTHIMLKIMKH